MNTDIRIAVTFKGNRKRLRLKAALGPGATDHLLDLWITVAVDRPDGVLSGLDAVDIAIMAGWPGDPTVFLQALLDAKFLDEEDGVYSIHDWPEHNPFAADAEGRGNKGRLSRLASTDRALWEKLKGEGYTGISAAELTKIRAENNGTPPRLPKGKKIVYGECVTLTEVEHAALVEKYGAGFTTACIAKLSNYKGKPGAKQYKSDYRAILKWVADEVAKKFKPEVPTGGGGKTAEDVLQANADVMRRFCGDQRGQT